MDCTGAHPLKGSPSHSRDRAANHCHPPSPPLPDLGRISPPWLLERLDQELFLGSVLSPSPGSFSSSPESEATQRGGIPVLRSLEARRQGQERRILSSSPLRRGSGAVRSPRRAWFGGCSLPLQPAFSPQEPPKLRSS